MVSRSRVVTRSAILKESRRDVSPTFRALRNANYRLWAAGAIVSNTGTWMQRVAQDWLVLTGLTRRSPGWPSAVTTGLQFAPVLLLAPVAGVTADRLDRRRVLIGTQSLAGVLALALGLLVVVDVAQFWHVYVLAGAARRGGRRRRPGAAVIRLRDWFRPRIFRTRSA